MRVTVRLQRIIEQCLFLFRQADTIGIKFERGSDLLV